MHFFWEGHPSSDNNGLLVNLIQSNTYGISGTLGYDKKKWTANCGEHQLKNDDKRCIQVFYDDQL